MLQLKYTRVLIALCLTVSLISFNGCARSSSNSSQSTPINEAPSESVQSDLPETPASESNEETIASDVTILPQSCRDEYPGLVILDDEENEIVRCSDSKEAQDKLNYFLQAMVVQVSVDLQTQLRIGEAEAQDVIFNRHTRIFSTMNQTIQKIMDKVITDTTYYPGEADPDLQSAMVIIDYHIGQVKALSGGRDKDYAGVNRATNIVRQPGSTFQILASYAPAIDMGLINADSIVIDEPFSVDGFEPQNWWGNSHKGEMTVRQAVAQSANVIAVKIATEAGIDNCFDYLEIFHFTTLTGADGDTINGMTFTDKTPALVLGGLTHGVTLFEQTAAYSAIANDGVFITPILYTRVYNNEGKELLWKEPPSHQVLTKDTANSLTDIMCGVVSDPIGTGLRAGFRDLHIPVAGKTGSTTDNTDLSFIGYTPYYAAGIWSGYDDRIIVESGSGIRPMLFINQGFHLDMWRDVMEEIHKEFSRPEKSFPFAITDPVSLETAPIPTVTPAPRYIDTANDFLKEIPTIVDEYDNFELGLYKLNVSPITKEQVNLFAFESWIPVDEPDENIRAEKVSVDINTIVEDGIYVLVIGDSSNYLLLSNDCKMAWTITISMNRGYPGYLQYQIPDATAKYIKALCDTVQANSPS